jgi:tetratricopeptide (TPR) repeat protein
MNLFKKIFFFIPTMVSFLKGHQMFNERNYSGAILKFEKCLKHPKFNNDLLFSLYGQALCASGKLSEAHKYLKKACDSYESGGWLFESEFSYNLASNSIDALKHSCEQLGIDEGKEYFSKRLEIKEK